MYIFHLYVVQRHLLDTAFTPYLSYYRYIACVLSSVNRRILYFIIVLSVLLRLLR